jgi:segregation and condensation protein B
MPAGDDPQTVQQVSLPQRLEALLFVSSAPVTPGQLAAALQVPQNSVESALASLERSLSGRGLQLQRHRGGLQLTTAPTLATDVERFLNLESSARLTRAALEVLAIIAYQQPATRPRIDAVRGVNSDSVLRTLLRHGLIEESGRSEGPGRPILYTTTPDFLQYFGLSSLEELPPLSPDATEAALERTAELVGDPASDEGAPDEAPTRYEA